MSILNSDYYNNLLNQIDNTHACSELQNIVDDINAEVVDQISGLQNQISKLQQVITPPEDIYEAVTWINNYISIISGPYNTAIAKQAEILTKLTELNVVLQNKIDSLQCDITLPTP